MGFLGPVIGLVSGQLVVDEDETPPPWPPDFDRSPPFGVVGEDTPGAAGQNRCTGSKTRA